MIELLIITVIFVLLILIVIWTPFLRQNSAVQKAQEQAELKSRDETNVALYHEHKAEIERDYEQGAIDQENYEYLIAELEKSLVQHIEGNQNADEEFDRRREHFSVIWPSLITVFVLVFSIGVYMQTGFYEKISQQPQAQVQSGGHEQLDDGQQMIVRVQKLQMITENDPQNSEAWYDLGLAYVGVGEFDLALNAFDKVLEIEGDVADVYGAKAQASYYQAEQQITPEVQQNVDKALALDPLDPSTNILLGMHNFVNQNYQSAISYWEKVLESGRETINVAALTEAVAEAKNRLTLTGNAPESVAMSGPQLNVNVSLSEEIYNELALGDDKTVFIYATPVDGSRMPVAAIKLNASDLPMDVVLNDARAMTPQAKLSDHQEVHLYAIVSKDGSAGIKAGDFKAEQLGVSVSSSETVNLVVDHLVK